MTRRKYYRLLREYEKIQSRNEQNLSNYMQHRLSHIKEVLIKQFEKSTHTISDAVMALEADPMKKREPILKKEEEKLIATGNRIYALQQKIENGENIQPGDYEETFYHVRRK